MIEGIDVLFFLAIFCVFTILLLSPAIIATFFWISYRKDVNYFRYVSVALILVYAIATFLGALDIFLEWIYQNYGPWLESSGYLSVSVLLERLILFYGWLMITVTWVSVFAVPYLLLKYRSRTFSILKAKH